MLELMLTTAMMMATRHKLLRDARADVDNYNDNGYTALMAAARGDHVKCVKLLLQAGADVNLYTNDNSFTAIQCAKSEECLELLIQAGADVNITYSYEAYPLISCARRRKPKMVEMLLNAGADVNCRDKAGYTALNAAAAKGDDQCVDLLIRYGADVNTKAYLGNRALINVTY